MKKETLLFILVLTVSGYPISAKSYNILDFGAIPNELSTKAIQQAIDACYHDGGGTVLVPAGIYITGTIILKSKVTLHLEQGSELVSSKNLEDFIISSLHYGMIFCQDATQVSITGEGVIHALGKDFYETDKNHGVNNSQDAPNDYDKMLTRQKENYMPEGVFFTDGPIKRKPRPGMTIVFFHNM